MFFLFLVFEVKVAESWSLHWKKCRVPATNGSWIIQRKLTSWIFSSRGHRQQQEQQPAECKSEENVRRILHCTPAAPVRICKLGFGTQIDWFGRLGKLQEFKRHNTTAVVSTQQPTNSQAPRSSQWDYIQPTALADDASPFSVSVSVSVSVEAVAAGMNTCLTTLYLYQVVNCSQYFPIWGQH